MRTTLIAIATGLALGLALATAALAEQPTSAATMASDAATARHVVIPATASGQLAPSEGTHAEAEPLGAHADHFRAILIMLAAIALFRRLFNPVDTRGGTALRARSRVRPLERTALYLMASALALLVSTGLDTALGSTLVLPIVGPYAFAVLAPYANVAHTAACLGLVCSVMALLLFRTTDRTAITESSAGNSLHRSASI